MNNKRPGEGLAIIIKKIKFFRNCLHLPPPCPEHGRQHLFAKRMGNEEPSYKCMANGCRWSSDLESFYLDWLKKKHKHNWVLNDDHTERKCECGAIEWRWPEMEKCQCDNWKCNKKHDGKNN